MFYVQNSLLNHNLKRNATMLKCLAPLLALAWFTITATAAPKPNIIFMMVDDLGKDWIGCYGGDNIETPNIDALARGGMKFTNAWSMPQCTPSRVTLLTERRLQGPRGAAGGEDGSVGENVLIREESEERLPGKISFDALEGDIISIRSPGGGGWGREE